jgi:toxin ParE1/3/4
MGHIERSTAARADLIGHFVYLAEEASEATANRFLERAEGSFNLLRSQPEIGALVPTQLPALVGVRKWRVKDFDRFLIFYVPIEGGVRVIRVLHAAQDWWGLFDLEE